MKLAWMKVQIAVTELGGWPSCFVGGTDGLMITPLVFMELEYVTGVICVIADKKLSGAAGFRGIVRKVFIFMPVGVANTVDVYVLGGGNALRGTVICFCPMKAYWFLNGK